MMNFKTFRTLFFFMLMALAINVQAQPNPCNCDFTFDPVCVEDANGDIIPFPNSCLAECEGFTTSDFVDCDFDDPNPCGCDFTIDPVCVEDGNGEIIPFPNSCLAECEGYTAADFVDCDNGGGGDPNPCGCDFTFEPVCVDDGNGGIIPFPNSCLAECEGYTAAEFVDCDNGGGGDPNPCGCDITFEPVCVTDANGEIIPFPNSCLAECEGYTAADFVDCDFGGGDPNPCGCDFTFEPVCVEDSSGVVVPFPNACWAECEGYTAADFVDCDFDDPNPCGCDFTFEPVCVEDANGTILSFPNSCLAECEGYTAADFVDCDFGGDPNACGCDFTFEPVCVEDSTGLVIPFPNACWAECEGYTVDDFVDCDSLIFPPMDDCAASFWYDYDWNDPLSVQFTDYSYNATSWSWDFGDGNTSTDQNPLHVYAAEGVYDVTLTISNDSCTSTITQHICILGVDPAPECEAFFYYDFPDFINDPLTLEFNDLSINANSWTWDFGDGNTSTEQNPTHTYAADGVYDVTLTIESDSCTSTYTEHICIFSTGGGGGGTFDECFALFIYDQDEPTALEINFLDISFASGPVNTWAWDFGDGNTSDEQNPTHTYAGPGEYTVTLTIETDSCTSTFEGLVWILEEDDLNSPFIPSFTIIGAGEWELEFINSYPNPAIDILNVELETAMPGKWNFFVQSISGSTVQSTVQDLSKGKNKVQLNVSDLQSGIYFLQVQNEGTIKTMKFVK